MIGLFRIPIAGLVLTVGLTIVPHPTGFQSAIPAAASWVSEDPSPAVTAEPTPDPYDGLTIAELSVRAYGDGELETETTLAEGPDFTRYLIRYPSDGLTIYGFMNIPKGEGPFPVVLVLHGYVRSQYRKTLTYTTRYADALAQAGYLVIHPNYRDHPPSDSDDGPNLFRIGYAVDVLDLVGLIQKQGGEPGPLEKANPDLLGLWGHSMGGGISLRVIAINPDVRAALVYGSMSSDERLNHERIKLWSGGQGGDAELAAPEETLDHIEPINFLDDVRAAVSIHHGALDETVPPEWSADLYERLKGLDKNVEYFEYSDQPHTFAGDGDQLFIERTIAFFDEQLRDPDVPAP